MTGQDTYVGGCWDGLTHEQVLDQELARRLVVAEETGDADVQIECLNAICDRLRIPLDHTEQGISDTASRAIDAWLAKQGAWA